MKAQRNVWGEEILSLARSDDRVLVLDADLATSTQAVQVATELPDSFVELGIAEANMVGVAFGLTTLGYRPWLSTFGVFLTCRALDQIRMMVSQTNAPVRLAGAYAGLLNGSSGKTHQDIQDLATMRAMPNMTVLVPADEFELAAMMPWIADHDGPVYVRVARDAVEPVFDADYRFSPGRVHVLRQGDDVTLVSTGVQTSRVIEAAGLLAEDGIEAKVVHVSSLKPIDEDGLVEAIGASPLVVTVEEHSVHAGLGGLVAEILSGRGGPRVVRHGLEDRWSESAPNDFLLDKYGLSPRRVADRVAQALGARSHGPRVTAG
ncbi:transketolase subunit B [Raineyella antarctica]|uniref:Transketolase subunit B n=1 Tax=Raineyella antarctica TaxID=1577474 RepID=A0A1G6GEW1_9ACTN|nr:transketolase C-terminal domain-containing protein [Raineyella antarctica]SDB80552.1 transketolase subunit B [Raineyella antarctica]